MKTEHEHAPDAAAAAPEPARESYAAHHGDAPERDHAAAHQSDAALAAFLAPDPAVADDTGEFEPLEASLDEPASPAGA